MTTHDQAQKTRGGVGAAAILAGLAVGGLVLFGGGKKASASTKPSDADACANLTKNSAPFIAAATIADLKSLGDLLDAATVLGCTDLMATVAKKIKDLGGSAPPVATPPKTTPGKTTPGSTFIASNTKDPVRAYNLAIAFSNAKPSSDWAVANPTRVDPSNGTFKTLADYGAYPGNTSSITVFQDASGLISDGKVGAQTNAAFSYWLGHGGRRPDGSTDVRISGEMSISGEKLCVACGHESATKVGGCCASCEKNGGGCGEMAAENSLGAVMALDQMGELFSRNKFGQRVYGNGGSFGGVDPNPTPTVGGCATGSCFTPAPPSKQNRSRMRISDDAAVAPIQTKAINALAALRSKVSGDLSSFIDVAEDVVYRDATQIDFSQIPVVPGTEPIFACLQSYVTERSLVSR